MASITSKRLSCFLHISTYPRIPSPTLSTGFASLGSRRRLASSLPFQSSCSRSVWSPESGIQTRQTGYQETRRSFINAHSYRQQQPQANSSPPDPPSSHSSAASNELKPNTEDYSQGLQDQTPDIDPDLSKVDWTRSYQGLSSEAFSADAAKILQAPINIDDIEVKSDGIIYLPEIKYRRILNQAFGPGGWGLAPRGETIVTSKAVTREYALVVLGRLVSIARGEQDYFNPDGIPTAVEGCKSTALRRCCKDLGIASELWDPRFIRKFMADHVQEVFVEHATTKKRRKIYLRKGDKVQYPWKEAR